jgi:hypothetical protein
MAIRRREALCGIPVTGMASGLRQPEGIVLSANRGGAIMLRSPSLSAFAALGLAALWGCAVPANQSRTGTLLSISVSPATAQDNGSAAGVQFTATGTFSTPPVSVSPLPANWSFTGFLTIPTPGDVTIDNTGLAHCTGFKGTVQVFAIHPVDPNVAPPQEIPPVRGWGLSSAALA